MAYQFLLFPNFRSKALTLSYDDGVPSDRKLIEIMSKYGLKGTFNLNSGLFEAKWRMSKEEVLELYPSTGNEVAIHGVKHYTLTEIDDAAIMKEILCDREALEETFGHTVTGMAYANGKYDDRVVDILKHCGVEYARTTVSTENFEIPTDWLRMPATCHHKNPRLMELAHEFIEKEDRDYFWSRKPRLFYLWGHSYEFKNEDNWYIIEEFAEYMGNRDDVWYATNKEIYDYVKAYESLVYPVSRKYVYNPTQVDVYLNWFDKRQVLVPAGKTVSLVD